MENKITLKMISEEVGVLQRNGQDMICPMVAPVTLRQRTVNALGQPMEQIQIQKSPCISLCPLFLLKQTHYTEVNLCCGSGKASYTVTQIIPYAKPEEIINTNSGTDNSKIINLNGQI